MIDVTRLDRIGGSTYAINSDLIERIVENPDTTLHMADGSIHLVAESKQEVIELIITFRARVISLARDFSSQSGSGANLTVVHPADRAEGQNASVLQLPRK